MILENFLIVIPLTTFSFVLGSLGLSLVGKCFFYFFFNNVWEHGIAEMVGSRPKRIKHAGGL